MAKTRGQKEQMLQDLTDKAQSAKSMVFVHFDGLKVKEIEQLRKEFRQNQVDYVVAKKTLMQNAFKQANIAGVDAGAMQQGIGIAFGMEDEVAPAKIAQQFSKEHEALKIFGGVLERNFVDADKVLQLAKLPSRDELIAKVVGSINAPVSGFVNVLAGNLRNLVYALNAIKESKS